MTIEQLYELFQQHPQVETDTRKIEAGDIFFALSGPNFNGNTFAKEAILKGASYAIVDENIPGDHGRIIKVDNVLNTLQALAKYHREQFDIPFIAITGSNGKTTTKELVSTVLSKQYKTYTTQGNLNNHIGVPLTLLRIKHDAEMAVVEMGANHQKEIEGYCRYAKPTHGIITNIGKAHLEGFGGEEGVKKGKAELFDYLRSSGGTAFIFNDYDYLHEISSGIDTIVKYGTANGIVVGRAVPGDELLSVEVLDEGEHTGIRTNLVGSYNLPNVLCAIAVGRYFKVPLQTIAGALQEYLPGNSRSQMVVKGSNHIILDAYNANPSSMQVAIENMARIVSPNKVLMLGGMMELGRNSVQEHQKIVDLIGLHSWSKVILVGGDFKYVSHPYMYFDTSAEAAEWCRNYKPENAYVLVKGSRSIQMEKIMEAI